MTIKEAELAFCSVEIYVEKGAGVICFIYCISLSLTGKLEAGCAWNEFNFRMGLASLVRSCMKECTLE
jgi:hypothetical protein